MPATRTTAVSLADARQWYLGVGPGSSDAQELLALRSILSRAIRDQNDCPYTRLDGITLRIHAHCMLGPISELNRLLASLVEELGSVCVALLINRRVMTTGCPWGSVGITAMLCAAGWNTGTQKLRLLYSYGGRVDETDERGLFLEETVQALPYFNHIAVHRGSPSPGARRMPGDFQEVVEEIERLAGERDSGGRWHRPDVVLEVPANLVPR